MNQFVADYEYRLCFHSQQDRQEHILPDCELIHYKDFPQAENEDWWPQKRPAPDRQIVPEQAAFRRQLRVHVASVGTQRPIERSHDTHEEKWCQQPPASIDLGSKQQRKNTQRQIVRKGVANRRFDVWSDASLVRA